MIDIDKCIACQVGCDDYLWKYYGCPNHTCKTTISDIAASDVGALKFIDTAASPLPEMIHISSEEMRRYEELKKEINSKTQEELHREAQARWNK
jgi:hypothetical protein